MPGHPVERPKRAASAAPIILRSAIDPATAVPVAKLVWTVLKDFFFLQFAARSGLKAIPVVNVDHPLDENVPFSPSHVGPYLDFVAFWVRPLVAIGDRCGRDARRRCTRELVAVLQACYRGAAKVYRTSMTTTSRPLHLRGRFALIHLLDPHLMCVPSLHVMTAMMAYNYYRRALVGRLPDARLQAASDELRAGVIDIMMAVLFVKQHGVNCVAGALYACHRLDPHLDVAHLDAMIDAMFADGEVDASGEVRRNIRATFHELVADGAGDENWTHALTRFIARLDAERPALHCSSSQTAA